MKKRVAREIKTKENHVLSGIFGVALFVAIIASLLLVGLYSPRNQTLTGDIILEGVTGFDLTRYYTSRVYLDVNLWQGQESIPFLYISSNAYSGAGAGSGDKLTSSDGNVLVYNITSNNDKAAEFVLSYNSSQASVSYVLSATISDSGGVNKTTIRDEFNGRTLCQDKIAGEVCSIGSAQLIIEEVVYSKLSSQGRWVKFRAGEGVSFNKVFDAVGNYIILPSLSEFPTGEYNLSVYDKSGMIVQKFRAYLTTSYSARAEGLCFDADNGGNSAVQGFATKGAEYRNDACLNNESLSESVCVDGNIGYAIFNCSSVSSYGGRCENGRCISNAPVCAPNWTAYNTSCQNDYMTRYFVDRNNCGAEPGRPQNTSIFCGEVINGLRGTRSAIGVHGVEVDLKIGGEPVNYSRNYSGSLRDVLIFDDENNASLAEFRWNFSRVLDLSTIFVQKQHSSLASKGYVIVNGLEMNKTVYVDKINAFSTRVCIKDASNATLSSISQFCDRVDEVLLDCPGEDEDEGYSCEIVDDRFVITGLRHSAVIEYFEQSSEECVPDWQCGLWGDCGADYNRTRTCTDINYCGDLTGKPSLTESCYEPLSNFTGLTYAFDSGCNWRCTPWEPSPCPSDTKMQSRTCTETNGCGSPSDKPIESKICIPLRSDTIFYVLIVLIIAAVLAIAAVVAYILFYKKPLVTESHVNPPAAPIQPGQRPFQPRGPGPSFGQGFRPS